jgi:chromosomal replication initiator protein
MKNLWTKSLDILKNKTSEQNFNTWIKPIQIKEIEGNIIRAEVPNKFIKDWVKENYKKTIEDTFS